MVLGAKQLVTQEMSGFLDEVAIWSRVLTEQEITQLWNSGQGISLLSTGNIAHSPVPADDATGVVFSGGVRLKWKPASAAEVTGYDVYFGPTDQSLSFRATVTTVDPDGYLHLDIPVVEFGYDSDLFWRVNSITAANPIPGVVWSFTTETQQIFAPGPVTGFSAKGGHKKNVLSWSEPEDDGGSPIQSYQIYRGPNQQNLVQIAEISPTEFICEDLNVVNGTSYAYAVSAANISEGLLSVPIVVESEWNDFDYNFDGIVNWQDYAIFLQEWMWQAWWYQS